MKLAPSRTIAALALLAGALDACTKPPKCAYDVISCPLVPTNATTTTTTTSCYHKTGTRPVSVLSECAPNREKSGALCYQFCREGYHGAGPVCWQNCPSGFRDDGAYCAKPGAYGRGAGYPWQVGDALNLDGARQRCLDQNPQGCEQDGLIYYPKCKPGFHAAGCCICSPDCPSGMSDIGASCQKDGYWRDLGSAMSCPGGTERIGALCYGDCPAGWDKSGVQCMEQKQTCTPVTAYQQCEQPQPICFKLVSGTECATAALPVDSEAHGIEYYRLCGGYAATKISCDRLTTACSCGNTPSGFHECVGGNCRVCEAGEWADSTGCFGC